MKSIGVPRLWPVVPKSTKRLVGRPKGKKNNEATMVQIAFWVEEELKETIKLQADKNGENVSEFCRNIFKKVLN